MSKHQEVVPFVAASKVYLIESLSKTYMSNLASEIQYWLSSLTLFKDG